MFVAPGPPVSGPPGTRQLAQREALPEAFGSRPHDRIEALMTE